MNTFGDRIFELRRGRDMTQEALAEQLGVTAQAVSKWERDESMPDVALLPKIAEVFDVTIDSLFGVEKAPVAVLLPEEKRDIDQMVLRVLVQSGGDNVKVNLPISFIRSVLEIGIPLEQMVNVGDADLSKVDFAAIIRLIEKGIVGRLIEVETDGGDIIIVEVV